MDVKHKIVNRVVQIFMVAFAVLMSLLFLLPSGVLSEIDDELKLLSDQMIQDAVSLEKVQLDDFEWPDQNFETGGSFFVVLDRSGAFIKGSANLPANARYLSRELIPNDPASDQVTDDSYTTRVINGQQIRIAHTPILGEFGETNLVHGHLQLGRLIGDYTAYRKLIFTIICASLAALCAAIWVLTKSIPHFFRPLEVIIETVQGLNSPDDLSHRINVYEVSNDNDEFRNLSVSFNDLIARMESQFKTQQRLLADVSHELRTPLTSVQGNVDLMRRMGKHDDDSIESLDAIESEAERMSRLVNDLLTLARADVGGLPIQHDHVDLDVVFLKAYEQVSLIDPKIKVILRDLVQIEVIGDEDRLRQLILNLMTNAVKYSNPGGTVIVELSEDKGDAVITISDSGLGISAEDLPHIFDRFYRVNRARTRERGGSGLGLAIVDSIVTAHRGSRYVTSVMGEGSTFTVRLPASHVYEQTI